jgi:hypothetical protein
LGVPRNDDRVVGHGCVPRVVLIFNCEAAAVGERHVKDITGPEDVVVFTDFTENTVDRDVEAIVFNGKRGTRE